MYQGVFYGPGGIAGDNRVKITALLKLIFQYVQTVRKQIVKYIFTRDGIAGKEGNECPMVVVVVMVMCVCGRFLKDCQEMPQCCENI